MKLKKLQIKILTKSIGFYINSLAIFSSKNAASKAYQIFSTPRAGKLTIDSLPTHLLEAKKEVLAFENHQIQTYIWDGNETKILLAHGWESNAKRWKKMLPYLQKTGATIIALDAPAHGLSSGKEFNAILYSKFIKVVADKHQPESIIAHSVGGMASFYYQHQHKNTSIKKIVLLGAPSELTLIFNNYVALLSLNKKAAKALEQFFIERFNIQLNEFSLAEFAKTMPSNGLIIHDADDFVVLYSEGKKVHNNWENSSFIETKNLGHGLQSKDVFNEIVSFISK